VTAAPAALPATYARPRARWVFPPDVDSAVIERLERELLLPAPVCRLLALRGFHDVDAAKTFLRPRLEHLAASVPLLDLDRAVARILRAIEAHEVILVHGDYDVDGMCSTTVVVRTILALGGDARAFIPRRLDDGYDLSAAGVRAAREAGATLVITCDCGTSAHEPIAELQAAGIDVIVTDHHLPGGPLPAAYAVLNPKRPGCPSTDKDLAAVGVAYKLALALTRAAGGNENVVHGMLDLVALATIADVAPLRGENRVLVRYGLKLINESSRHGVRALVRAAGMSGKPLTAGRVGFIIAPRLNAAGRLAHALRGVELLTSDSEHEANAIARDLEELNARRQELDRATLDAAREMVLRLDLPATFGIVLAGEGWHPGVIGIVASRLVEEFGRPVVLVALDGHEGKGSGRSISRFDLHAALGQCRDLLLRFGGHRAAAGVTVRADQVEAFARRFNEVASAQLAAEDLVPELRVDLEVRLSDANEELDAVLKHLEPCGVSNPSPVLVARGVTLAAAPRSIGKDGIKMLLRQDDTEIVAIGWGMAKRGRALHVGQSLDIAFRLERDEWNGESRLQARLVDFAD